MEIAYRLDDISEAAKRLWQAIGSARVLAFDGAMGAGKTTFIHAICRQLGVAGVMSSPSFSIINEYESTQAPVYHIDLYRCSSEEEAVRAGVEDCLYSGNICLVEWPTRAPHLFPPDTVWLRFTETDAVSRRIVITDKNHQSINN